MTDTKEIYKCINKLEVLMDIQRDCILRVSPEGLHRRVLITEYTKTQDAHRDYKKRERKRKIRKWLFGYDYQDKSDLEKLSMRFKEK